MQIRKLVAAVLGTMPLLGIVGTLIIGTGLAAERSRAGRPQGRTPSRSPAGQESARGITDQG